MTKTDVIKAEVDTYIRILLELKCKIDMSRGKNLRRPNQFVTFWVNDIEHNMKVWDLPRFFRRLLFDEIDELKEKAWKYDEVNK